MATRFYLPPLVEPEVNPAFDSAWNKTSDADRRECVPTRLGYGAANKTSSEDVSTSPYNVLARQYVSRPIAGMEINGTVKGQIRCQESNVNADFMRGIVIRVVSRDGNTVRGTLLSSFPALDSSEYSTSLTNRNFPPSTSLSAVTAEDGDRIVIEIGTTSHNTQTASRTATHRFTDNNATDLPEDESTTADNNAWIEFSANLTFLVEPQVIRPGAVQEVPTFQTGYARNITEARFPDLWKGLVGLWTPSLGHQAMTLVNLSSPNNDGVMTGMEAADWVMGSRGAVLDYDGNNDYVNLPKSPVSAPPYSLVQWIKTPGTASRNTLTLADTSANTVWCGFGNSATDNMRWFNISGGNQNIANIHAIKDGWHCFVGIYAATSDSRFWMDGELKSTSTTAAAISGLNGGSIGNRRRNALDNYWVGQIGDTLIYNRVLSPQEIQLLSTGASPLHKLQRRLGLVPGAAPPQTILPISITSGEAFGTPKVNLTVKPSAIPSAEALGSPQLNLTILPSGITSAEALGEPKVKLQARPDAITSTEAFGNPTVTVEGGAQTVAPTAIPSAETFGAPKLNLQTRPDGLASNETFGSPQLKLAISASSIPSAETFGSAQINLQIQPNSIPSAETLGIPQLNLQIRPSPIPSAETFGNPILKLQLRPNGIPSAESFGIPIVSIAGLSQTINPTSIPSSENPGFPYILGGVTRQRTHVLT